MRRFTTSNAIALALVGTLLLGCGGFTKVRQAAAQQQRATVLKQIGLAYYEFIDNPLNKGKSPANAAELQPYLIKVGAVEASQALSDGSLVFIYGVRAPEDMPNGTSNYVLAYDVLVPTQGGVVLFADGSVRVVTLVEFGGLTLAAPGQGEKDDKKDDKKDQKKLDRK